MELVTAAKQATRRSLKAVVARSRTARRLFVLGRDELNRALWGGPEPPSASTPPDQR